jgi:hypothetical protein
MQHSYTTQLANSLPASLKAKTSSIVQPLHVKVDLLKFTSTVRANSYKDFKESLSKPAVISNPKFKKIALSPQKQYTLVSPQ